MHLNIHGTTNSIDNYSCVKTQTGLSDLGNFFTISSVELPYKFFRKQKVFLIFLTSCQKGSQSQPENIIAGSTTEVTYCV